MSGGIAPEDLIAAAGFVGVLLAVGGYQVVRSLRSGSPRERMRQRMLDNVAEVAPVVVASHAAEESSLRTVGKRKRFGDDSALMLLLERARTKAEHMGGAVGLRLIAAAAAAAAMAMVVALLWVGVSPWLAVVVAAVSSLVGAVVAFRVVVVRYRARFLANFPDALDLIIRAVRAGVPVVQAIIGAGRELPDPVGREFRLMGDSLRLGMDAQEVMDAASTRIGVPDFRFFVVCLQLQRETGGPLAETLENLAAIIRSRREVRLKTRAVTAQGRAASKIIALVPFVVMGALHLVGGGYLDVMFHTDTGQKLLWTAVGLVAVGLLVINRMAQLEE